jgi:hypothetical protein
MKKGNKNSKKSTPTRGSLLSPEAMGGINAGKGLDFQTRFAACHVPLWLLEAAIHRLFFEGTGDIDIRYTEAGKAWRIHIQVKDHDVTASEFKEVIENFINTDAGLPDTSWISSPSMVSRRCDIALKIWTRSAGRLTVSKCDCRSGFIAACYSDKARVL